MNLSDSRTLQKDKHMMRQEKGAKKERNKERMKEFYPIDFRVKLELKGT